MAILKDFGLSSLAEELLVADGVHSLRNLLSLEHGFHLDFDNMDLWFEGTNEVGHLLTFLRYQPNVCADQLLPSLFF